MTNKNQVTKLTDKNGIEIRTGQIVTIEGGYFKSNNGTFTIINSPGDADWSGDDYCLQKINKNGTLSKSKNNLQFWPLITFVSSREKADAADAHNAKHATIEITSMETVVLETEGLEEEKEATVVEIIEEIEAETRQSEEQEETIIELSAEQKEAERIALIKQGVEKIKKAGRMKTSDFEDIILKLAPHGLGYVDAYNQITGLYLYQLEQEEQQAKQATPPPEPQIGETENDNMTVEISYNEEKNGIELKFDGKPSDEVRANLKANGFRWSKYQKIWYAKDTPERRAFADSFNGTVTESEPKTFEYPEIDIDDLDNYTVPAELSRREHDSNWVFRTKERDHNSGLKEVFEHYQSQALEIINSTDDKATIYYIKRDLQRFKKAYHSNYIALLTNKANNPSWAVTGRAGRNMSKYQKTQDRYGRLLEEYGEIKENFEFELRKHQGRIRRLKTVNMQNSIENTDLEIIFKVETKEVEYIGYKQKVRTYSHNNYMIAKLWASYRIFKDGEEVPRHIVSLRTTDTLETAKKAVQMLVSKEKAVVATV